MDDFTELLVGQLAREEQPAPGPPSSTTPTPEDPNPGSSSSSSSTPRRGIRGRVAAFREKASIQDRMLDRLLRQLVPSPPGEDRSDGDGGGSGGSGGSNGGGSSDTAGDLDPSETFAGRPGFNITTMTANFRRFNSRISPVFRLQARAMRVLSWRRPAHTLSLLAVYTFACLDPHLLAALPLAVAIFAVFIPSFVARHPAVPEGGAGGGGGGDDASTSTAAAAAAGRHYSPHGPPLAAAAAAAPVRELSRDFFRNLRDLQNCMDDFTRAHDAVTTGLLPLINFSDEALSSTLFVAAAAACALLLVAGGLLPWRLLFLAGGWAAAASAHPGAPRLLAALLREPSADSDGAAGPDTATMMAKMMARPGWVNDWIAAEIILDAAPDTREVEVFELQRSGFSSSSFADGSDEWEPWVFSGSAYEPLSRARRAGARPAGTRFFEDVLPPDGWEWSEKKWALDLWSREWVEERIITGVEVETEGERWVYDMAEEAGAGAGPGAGGPSWEEGSDADVGRRGEWRRRRWVRMVKRRRRV